ncbi:hypothetical protein QM012_007585 [Aureobasidium pullulans]|uniref:Glucose-methanol-choline oxidoreductase N-terminal domain-containing protein n=1 Tax=Aureobasidium pullulans TaxID=5580 RepID=A0ABR0TNB8_AURPU
MVLGFFEEEKVYDFIVVGGGTAGNCVAGRLAETPNVSVLVIEAGTDNPLKEEKISTPALAFQLVESEYDWQYPVTFWDRDGEQRHEAKNTRGKVLGGSSCLNYYTWLRGSRPTYDEWTKYGGNEWNWDKCFPYFQKPGTMHDSHQILDHDPAHVASDGPLTINPAIPIPLAAKLQEAWKSQGHRLSDDIYNGTVDGLAHVCHTIDSGHRVPSTVFLDGHRNITVKPRTLVHRLLFSGETCVGVQTHATEKSHAYYARQEVIVCGGVFESPKLLMLSGIGPSDQAFMTDLTAISSGIGHSILSPHVGQNIQDHPVAPHSFKLGDGHSLDDVLRPGTKNLEAMAEYKLAKRGPLASSLLEMSGFARVDDKLRKCKEWREEEEKRGHDPLGPQGQPHFEFDFLPCFASPFLPHVPEPKNGNYMTIVVSLLRPLSRGSLTLKSANALDFPLINMNYLDHPLDAVALREGVRFVDEIILKGDGMRDIVIGEYPQGDGGIVQGEAQEKGSSDGLYGAGKGETDQGKSVEGDPQHMLGLDKVRDSDEGMAEWLKGRVTSGYHPCGSCRMGPTIEEGVVNSRLQVHGVRNLRIIDASVFPLIPDARIQNPVYMVAEKGADFIKQDHPALYLPKEGLVDRVKDLVL